MKRKLTSGKIILTSGKAMGCVTRLVLARCPPGAWNYADLVKPEIFLDLAIMFEKWRFLVGLLDIWAHWIIGLVITPDKVTVFIGGTVRVV